VTLPLRYDALPAPPFGGLVAGLPALGQARVAILPVPLDRTTSYVPGTRSGPREILVASSHVELWDEELGADVRDIGFTTMPEMELPFGEMAEVVAEIRRVAGAVLDHGAFLVMLGGEHSITPPAVAAAVDRCGELSVLQIDAHADLRDSYMGSPFNHACAMRRVLEHASAVQVGVRSLSGEEAAALPSLRTRIFYDTSMRSDPDWIDRVVDSLGATVYITIDCDGLDPGIMPAVGTPEPGGLSWYELLSLLRRTMSRRRVIGCDIVELCPVPGLAAPNFLCAKLLAKIAAYRFCGERL
jgi:agmatinase